MEAFTVRNGAWVVIGDGKKALILHNEGDADLLNLRRVAVREQNSAPDRQQGGDGSGRQSSAVAGRGAADIDWRQMDEDRFAAALAEELNVAAREHLFKELIVVAPPKTLAELRRELSKEAHKLIVAEIPKDYTHHPIPDIETMLRSHRPEPVTP